jgi:hypothetical protein
MMPNPPPPEIIMFHIYMNLSHFIFISWLFFNGFTSNLSYLN